MRGWSAPLEELLLRWHQQDWGGGVGREDRMRGLIPRCLPGVFASVLHALCTPPACFPAPSSILDARVHACAVAQSCPTLCNPMDYSLPGSSAYGIL